MNHTSRLTDIIQATLTQPLYHPVDHYAPLSTCSKTETVDYRPIAAVVSEPTASKH